MDTRPDGDPPPAAEFLPGWPPEPIGVRIRDVGEIAAALPHLLGFRPRESVVLVSLTGDGGQQVGLTVRADIPPPEHDRELARVLSRSLCTDRPDCAVIVIVSDALDGGQPGEPQLPHRHLAREMARALARRDVGVRHTLFVRDGHWWDYDCTLSCCRPAGGTLLPTEVTELEVAAIATGTVVERDRDDLAARLAPPAGGERGAMAAVCARIAVECSTAVLDSGPDAVAAASWSAVTTAAARYRPGAPTGLTDAEVARVVWGLRDGEVRDRALALALGADPAAAEQLWTECTRRAPAPLDAAPATLLAVCAWLRGDGAMANVALGRALASEPGYSLARLLSDALAACVTPADLRALLAEACPSVG
ncbi:DUF4192 domain-containing protein [Blastococcus sp. CT_GayMR16]|uniref:DUF4192 domain-containing protein n=1 Tax=Blastococcus sp. CT_GayMR16 TaxID=2559607 RepID=UPI001073DCF4|nr:DUF4192 domain-containing protein [Blastococcus sp. CT_GayMR16]TFV88492.1 DUF4192 domain-containing protein [Blastococcus sp. CT_GayMR16]